MEMEQTTQNGRRYRFVDTDDDDDDDDDGY